jgi:hypothetical protein
MVCTFIGTHCKHTTCIMRSLRRSSWCYWSAVDCDGRATVVEVGWRRCCLKDWWSACSSLRLTRWGVLFSEAQWSQRVDLAGSHLSVHRPAPIAGYIAASITYRANTRTALLELNLLTNLILPKSKPNSKSHYNWGSVSQYIKVSSPLWDL